MTGGLVKEAHAMGHRAALGIFRAEMNLRDARKGDGPGTHGAGLQRHIELRAHETFIAELFGRFADHQDFSMGSGVLQLQDPVAVCGKNLPLPTHQNGAHGHFLAGSGEVGLFKGAGHKGAVGGIGRHGLNHARNGRRVKGLGARADT